MDLSDFFFTLAIAAAGISFSVWRIVGVNVRHGEISFRVAPCPFNACRSSMRADSVGFKPFRETQWFLLNDLAKNYLSVNPYFSQRKFILEYLIKCKNSYVEIVSIVFVRHDRHRIFPAIQEYFNARPVFSGMMDER